MYQVLVSAENKNQIRWTINLIWSSNSYIVASTEFYVLYLYFAILNNNCFVNFFLLLWHLLSQNGIIFIILSKWDQNYLG